MAYRGMVVRTLGERRTGKRGRFCAAENTLQVCTRIARTCCSVALVKEQVVVLGNGTQEGSFGCGFPILCTLAFLGTGLILLGGFLHFLLAHLVTCIHLRIGKDGIVAFVR